MKIRYRKTGERNNILNAVILPFIFALISFLSTSCEELLDEGGIGGGTIIPIKEDKQAGFALSSVLANKLSPRYSFVRFMFPLMIADLLNLMKEQNLCEELSIEKKEYGDLFEIENEEKMGVVEEEMLGSENEEFQFQYGDARDQGVLPGISREITSFSVRKGEISVRGSCSISNIEYSTDIYCNFDRDDETRSYVLLCSGTLISKIAGITYQFTFSNVLNIKTDKKRFRLGEVEEIEENSTEEAYIRSEKEEQEYEVSSSGNQVIKFKPLEGGEKWQIDINGIWSISYSGQEENMVGGAYNDRGEQCPTSLQYNLSTIEPIVVSERRGGLETEVERGVIEINGFQIDFSEKRFSSLMKAGRDYIGCESQILPPISLLDLMNLLPLNNF